MIFFFTRAKELWRHQVYSSIIPFEDVDRNMSLHTFICWLNWSNSSCMYTGEKIFPLVLRLKRGKSTERFSDRSIELFRQGEANGPNVVKGDLSLPFLLLLFYLFFIILSWARWWKIGNSACELSDGIALLLLWPIKGRIDKTRISSSRANGWNTQNSSVLICDWSRFDKT